MVTVKVPTSYDLKDFPKEGQNETFLNAWFPIGKILLSIKKPTMIGKWEKYKNKGIPLRLRKYYWIRVK